MKTIAIIQARLNSSRFPGKVLAELCGKSVLLRVIEACKRAQTVDEVVVACAWEGGKGVISGHTNEHCPTYSPPVNDNDVLCRVVQVAEVCGADLIVRVCGDNPLILPGRIDDLVRAIRDDGRHKRDYDYAGYRFNDGTPAIQRPTGYFAEVVTFRALEDADNRLLPIGELETDDREHVTQFIYNRPGDYALRWLRVPEWLDGKSDVSIDTPEDLERVAEILGGKYESRRT